MNHRRGATLPLAVALGLAGALALAGVVAAAETTLTAELAGVMEGDMPGDEDGTGSATVTLDPETGEACWELTAENIGPVSQSHIHVGAEGESGDVVVPLDVQGFEGSSEGCVGDQDAETLQAIVDDPAGYYVNLHTEEFPAGAIRGQLAVAAGGDDEDGGDDAGAPDTAMAAPDQSATLIGVMLLAAAAAITLRRQAVRIGR